ncbi:MAG: hypothetical protein FWF00_02815 [Endomicrobia bacterium]|nr:hypothetical protein [Endomicrobiia bacterium]MCL2506556.1 hypothetical protein [Endomicrobiia bacterium]MCL2506607.1 hypothetical protein [Endomicrobiia bacterium]
MKQEIVLNPVKANLKLFENLEKKKLIKLIKPSKAAITTKTKTGAVSRFYTSKPEYGTHTLMCVGKRNQNIRLSWHEDNEDFILINPSGLKFKPLYLIVSLFKKTKFLKKFYSGKLTSKDLLAIELEFNNPKLSFWTMLKHTVHCEITNDEREQHPVFFVTESSKLKDHKLTTKIYDITLAEKI